MRIAILKPTKEGSISSVLLAGIIGGVAGMSDGFLYAYLPVNATAIGLSSFMVGILLSANRFIRILSNRWIAFWAQKFGVKNLFFAGILITILVCFLYAAHSVFIVWLIARFLWGICFSIIRFSKLQYSLACPQMATAMGWGKSLNEIIGIASYLIGPYLVSTFSGSTTYIIFGILLMCLLPIFYLMPKLTIVPQKIKAFDLGMPSLIDIWGFLISFGVDGMLIISISKLIQPKQEAQNLLLVASVFIAIRKGISILLSPVIGRLIDRLPHLQSVVVCLGLIFIGLLILAWWDASIGLTIVFIGSSYSHTLIPILAVKSVPKAQRFTAITKMTTARDLGSAFGALFGLNLVVSVSNTLLFTLSAVIINLPAILFLNQKSKLRFVKPQSD